MTARTVWQLKRGDRIPTERGVEVVLWNRKSGRPGCRFIRTSRTDHNWPADKVIEVEVERS